MDLDMELLRELTEASGVPGTEERIARIVRREFEESGLDVRTDAMGNVVGTMKGTDRPEYAVVVAAHMDEIGFMVRHIDEDGFLEVDSLGGWNPRVVAAQRVSVHTEDGDLPGVIGAPPPHLDDDETDGEEFDIEDVRVDLGLETDRVTDRVSVGDVVSMRARTERLGDNVVGKALDDRICVAVMLAVADRVTPSVTVHFAATVQEEVGLRGAEALGVDLDADLAIALDVTVANDVPGAEAGEHVTALGDGTAIKLKDQGVITNRAVTRRLRAVGEEASIPHQLEVLPRGGTDTARLQRAGGATPVGALSVPTRYLHTVTESANVTDVDATTDLLAAFLESETGEMEYTP